jgi:hypothetical protein
VHHLPAALLHPVLDLIPGKAHVQHLPAGNEVQLAPEQFAQVNVHFMGL